jgi:hypothetical protein
VEAVSAQRTFYLLLPRALLAAQSASKMDSQRTYFPALILARFRCAVQHSGITDADYNSNDFPSRRDAYTLSTNATLPFRRALVTL